MARATTRVNRSGGEDFEPNDGQDRLTLGGDVALVGDPGDGANIIADEGTEGDDKNWDLPEGGAARRPASGTGEEHEGEGYDEEDSRLAYSEEGDPDEAPRNQGRRARRNANNRAAQLATQVENAALRRQLDELAGTVNRLATGQQGLATNSLDTQMATMQGQLRIVDDEMADAVKNNDGDTYKRAQSLRDEIIGRLYTLRVTRDRMAQTTQTEQAEQRDGGQVDGQRQQQQRQQAPDPRVANYFDRFCERYDWFDPASRDVNCNIVRALDQELVTEGYQRNTALFWRQLEQRLAEDYKLRPGRGPRQQDDEGGDDDVQNERPERQDMSQRRQRPPTNGGRSSASGRSAGFRLSEIQTNILREEGLLEDKLSDEDKGKRQRIIDKWKRGATAERRGAV